MPTTIPTLMIKNVSIDTTCSWCQVHIKDAIHVLFQYYLHRSVGCCWTLEFNHSMAKRHSDGGSVLLELVTIERISLKAVMNNVFWWV